MRSPNSMAKQFNACRQFWKVGVTQILKIQKIGSQKIQKIESGLAFTHFVEICRTARIAPIFGTVYLDSRSANVFGKNEKI